MSSPGGETSGSDQTGASLSVGLLSLGCARNLVDSEVALGSLLKHGYRFEPHIQNSDIALVNTCGFIDESKQESIQAIINLVELKKRGKIRSVVVMGCLSQRYGESMRRDLNGVDAILGVNDFERIHELLGPLRSNGPVLSVTPKPDYVLNRYSPRKSLTPSHYAYVKISEGCINACAYCAIPMMKGKHRSRSIEDIVGQVKDIAKTGVSEINLIGQDIAAYGYDLEGKFLLPELLDEVAKASPKSWIRLLYAHPAHVTDDLYRVYTKHTNICRYIDLPVEHSHNSVLKRMNRGSTREEILRVIQSFRKHMPGIAVRTAMIVGFPGETEEEFQDLLNFMEETRFERLGCFVYSHEDGTRSFNMPNQVPDKVKLDRYHRVMTFQQKIIQELHHKTVGASMTVLVEARSKEKGTYIARSEFDAPEVDTQVYVKSDAILKPGDFVGCQINGVKGYDLLASV